MFEVKAICLEDHTGVGCCSHGFMTRRPYGARCGLEIAVLADCLDRGHRPAALMAAMDPSRWTVEVVAEAAMPRSLQRVGHFREDP